MTPDQATAIVNIIGELWRTTARPPEKGGYSPREIRELKDRLRKYPYEPAEAILSAMWAGKGNQSGPKVWELMARLHDVCGAGGWAARRVWC